LKHIEQADRHGAVASLANWCLRRNAADAVTRNAPPRNADEDDNAGLLALAVGGLAVGALAGLVGSAFHLALDSAHGCGWRCSRLAPERGLAAAFNAPLAGAIFVFEELLRRFELRIAIAALAACSAGLVVMRMLIGDRLVFSVPPIVVSLLPGYFFFLVFGAVIGVLGALRSRMVVAGLDAADCLRYLRPRLKQ
jgi:H+/Cl- antiporter ClcA